MKSFILFALMSLLFVGCGANTVQTDPSTAKNSESSAMASDDSSAQTSNTNTLTNADTMQEDTTAETMTTDTGLQYQDVTVGEGAEARSGQLVTVHYTGTLTDGTKFDSSVDRDTPFQFSLGAGQVIAGWDEGVAGMKIGGKRLLTIPPELGYGDRPVGPIPANSTLIFEVVLLEVE